MIGLPSTSRPLPSLSRSGLAAGLSLSPEDLMRTEEELLLFTVLTGTRPPLWWRVGKGVRVSGSAKVVFIARQTGVSQSLKAHWFPEDMCIPSAISPREFCSSPESFLWACYVSFTSSIKKKNSVSETKKKLKKRLTGVSRREAFSETGSEGAVELAKWKPEHWLSSWGCPSGSRPPTVSLWCLSYSPHPRVGLGRNMGALKRPLTTLGSWDGGVGGNLLCLPSVSPESGAGSGVGGWLDWFLGTRRKKGFPNLSPPQPPRHPAGTRVFKSTDLILDRILESPKKHGA